MYITPSWWIYSLHGGSMGVCSGGDVDDVEIIVPGETICQ